MEGFAKGFYAISEWVMRFMYLNLLWTAFTILGIIIFGFFPAPTAMYAVVRKWIMKKNEVKVFNVFWSTYKKEFIKSNLIGLLIASIGFIMYFNLSIIDATTAPLLKLLYIPNAIFILIYILTLFYIFPVLVHFDISIKEVMKNVLIIMTINPISTFCMGIVTGFLFYIYYHFPGLIPFFSGSATSFLLMWFGLYTFTRIDKEDKTIKLGS